MVRHQGETLCPSSLDDLDHRLIEMLKVNARLPLIQLAQALAGAAQHRSPHDKALEDAGIITGYTVSPQWPPMTALRDPGHGADRHRSRASRRSSNPQPATRDRRCTSVSGRHDLCAMVSTDSTRELDIVLDRMREVKGVQEILHPAAGHQIDRPGGGRESPGGPARHGPRASARTRYEEETALLTFVYHAHERTAAGWIMRTCHARHFAACASNDMRHRARARQLDLPVRRTARRHARRTSCPNPVSASFGALCVARCTDRLRWRWWRLRTHAHSTAPAPTPRPSPSPARHPLPPPGHPSPFSHPSNPDSPGHGPQPPAAMQFRPRPTKLEPDRQRSGTAVPTQNAGWAVL